MTKLLLAVVWCALASPLGAAPETFLKGVTISCQTWGKEWQTPEMARTLDEVQSLGANAFAIHPYAGISNDGHVRFRTIDENRHIAVPLDWARERGMSAMVIPHIAYWGSKFSWRGEIDFASAEEWDRFFSDYEAWIVEMARIAEAHHAAVFCVGLEFTHAQKFTDRWLHIIAEVRKVYFGKLTYGANWNEYEAVKFWDALDYIGVLAYFPLTDATNPTLEQLAAGWEKRCAELERFSQRNGGKQFLFVEIGYNESAHAAAEPWSFATGGEHAAEIQERCLAAALALTAKNRFLAGMFLWKWFPDLPMHEEEDFRLQTPGIKALIAKYWREGNPKRKSQTPLNQRGASTRRARFVRISSSFCLTHARIRDRVASFSAARFVMTGRALAQAFTAGVNSEQFKTIPRIALAAMTETGTISNRSSPAATCLISAFSSRFRSSISDKMIGARLQLESASRAKAWSREPS